MFSKDRSGWLCAAGILVVVVAVVPAFAQSVEDLVITSVYDPDQGDANEVTWIGPEGEAREVGPGLFPGGELLVPEGHRCMLYSPSGEVVIIGQGVAAGTQLRVSYEDARIDVQLIGGKAIFATHTRGVDQPVHFNGRPLDAGWTFATVGEGARASVRHLTDAEVAVVPPDVLADEGIDDLFGLDSELGLSSANMIRSAVQDRLFVEVIAWDREGQAEPFIESLKEVDRTTPELRVLVFAARTELLTAAENNRPPRSLSVAGANELPPLSPAALTVGDGVSAVLEANSNARRLLSRTSSRGLGFFGLRQLSLPSFSSGGVRNVGPAGAAGSSQR